MARSQPKSHIRGDLMFKRALCILLVLALSLACASTALADLTSVTDVEFETRPAYGVRPTEPPPTPTPIPTATPRANRNARGHCDPCATTTPTASPSPEPTHAPLSNGSRGAEVFGTAKRADSAGLLDRERRRNIRLAHRSRGQRAAIVSDAAQRARSGELRPADRRHGPTRNC